MKFIPLTQESFEQGSKFIRKTEETSSCPSIFRKEINHITEKIYGSEYYHCNIGAITAEGFEAWMSLFGNFPIFEVKFEDLLAIVEEEE